MNDIDIVRRVVGEFVGALVEEDLEAFERCVMNGTARRRYEGAAGFLGLASVALTDQAPEEE